MNITEIDSLIKNRESQIIALKTARLYSSNLADISMGKKLGIDGSLIKQLVENGSLRKQYCKNQYSELVKLISILNQNNYILSNDFYLINNDGRNQSTHDIKKIDESAYCNAYIYINNNFTSDYNNLFSDISSSKIKELYIFKLFSN